MVDVQLKVSFQTMCFLLRSDDHLEIEVCEEEEKLELIR